jgi:hypothetical protein
MATNIVFITLAILAAGTAATKCLLPTERFFETFAVHGFALGIVSAALTMLIVDLSGAPLTFTLVSGILIVDSALLWLWSLRRPPSLRSHRRGKNAVLMKPQLWKIAVFLAFGALLLIQLFFIGTEVALRPTYAWDAWRGWEPQAIQYFSNRALESEMPTISNYGVISNYLHTLYMLATDNPTEPMNHAPWLLTYCFLGVAIFGFLRDLSPIIALSAATFVLSIPIIATHVALAGYADLWLCFFFTVATISLAKYSETHSPRYLFLTFIYCIACASTKRTGLGLGLIVLGVAIWEFSAHYRKLRLTMLGVIASAALVVFSIALGIIEIRWALGTIGEVVLTNDEIKLPGIRNYRVQFEVNGAPYIEALFGYGSFSILAPLLVVLLGLLAFGGLSGTHQSSMLACSVIALFYFAFYFAVLSPASAADGTGLTRALLSIAPVLILQIALAVNAVGRRITEVRVDYQNSVSPL